MVKRRTRILCHCGAVYRQHRGLGRYDTVRVPQCHQCDYRTLGGAFPPPRYQGGP